MYNPSLVYSYLIKNFGIGHLLALQMCKTMNISPLRPIYRIRDRKLTKGYTYLKQKNHLIGYKLEDNILDNLLYNGQIKNVRSFKYSKFLPIRGQKNKSNAKTAKKQAMIFNKLLFERNKITKVIKIVKKKKTTNKKNKKK